MRPRAAAVETATGTEDQEAAADFYDEEMEGVEEHEMSQEVKKLKYDKYDETDMGSLEEMYAEFDKLIAGTVVTYGPGDTCNGTVLTTDRRGAMIDVGGKAAAMVELDEMSTAPISDVRCRSALLRLPRSQRLPCHSACAGVYVCVCVCLRC